jgi:homoaconitase/3-isopropylmalate dehydratase large subunit
MVRQAAGLLERATGMATDAADVIVPATYSVDEAARRLGISRRHAYALLERGNSRCGCCTSAAASSSSECRSSGSSRATSPTRGGSRRSPDR